jgi:hypothetical protein
MNSEEKKGFALGKQNLILIAISFALIVLGFLLMTGSSTETTFNPDIFSTRRITVGPMLSLFGFLALIVAILWKPKNKK